MKMVLGRACALLIAVGATAVSASAAVPDQIIEKWTETYPQSPNSRTEHLLAIRAGTLESDAVLFDKTFPNGLTSVHKIELARVKDFTADETAVIGMMTYRIGVQGLGDHDLAVVTYAGKDTTGVSHILGMSGFVTFGPDQIDLRNAVFNRLCALIGETPVIEGAP
jgi:hypothetical protein